MSVDDVPPLHKQLLSPADTVLERGSFSDRGERPVRELPDLTQRLKEQGIYGEYVTWRDNYMRWRKGEAKGAKGENTADAHEQAAKDFEYWYPTVKTFNFRRTIAFWGAITCAEGCLLFLWIPLVEMYGIGTEEMKYELTKVPNFVGGTMFLIGIYLAYFELINLDSGGINAGKYNYLWCDLSLLRTLEIQAASFLGAGSYLVGALLYTVSQVSDFFRLDAGAQALLVEWPLAVGGFLFFVAGCCELVVNGVLWTWPDRLVWFVACLNWYGGLTFWLSACPSVLAGDTATWVGVAGTLAYLVGAVLGLLMWRGEQFGGAMIPALNRVANESVALRRDPATGACHVIHSSKVQPKDLEEALNPRLSWRGVVFLNLYVFIAAAQWIACSSCLHHASDIHQNPANFRRFLNLFISGLVNIVIVHMLMVLNSAIVKMPKKDEEPYRSLAILMRLVSFVVLGNSILTLDIQLATPVGSQ
uniref:Uncharacterized protein n=1 Tax=Zooxanthella nutricula TaxID=1333877 RepID=A0A6U6K6Y3_9DINO|mmetsp:Transcript_25280/g.75989  ORF Transcript_25280/g.75989 Transcript_25280/m.75989 type:complete len:474 (+) Transcript_25280:75-1496(+)